MRRKANQLKLAQIFKFAEENTETVTKLISLCSKNKSEAGLSESKLFSVATLKLNKTDKANNDTKNQTRYATL